MIRNIIARLEQFEGRAENETVVQDLNSMLPGMLLEQVAAIFLENINVFVMGFISTAAIAGVGQVNTLNNVLMNLFQAFAIGGTVIVSQHAGAGRNRQAANSAFSALLLGSAVSILITIGIYLFRSPLILLLFGDAEEEVIQNSIAYFNFTALTPPLWFLYFQCCGFMRGAGDTRRPMLISIALNVTSMILNLVFSLGMDLGVTGAALSYLLSVGLAAGISLAMVLRKSFLFRPRRPDSQLSPDIKRIGRISFPSAAENIMFNGSKLVIQIFVAGMGTTMISANSVFNSVNSIFNVPFMALYYLVVPVVSHCAGCGDREKTSHALQYVFRRGFVWSLPIAAAHLLLSVPGSYLFSRDTAVIKIAAVMLAIYAVAALFQNGSYILPNGFKTVGDANFSMVVSSVTAWIIRVFGTWFLGVRLGWGAYAIAVTQLLDIAVRSVIYQVRFRHGTWLKEFSPVK